MGSRNPLGHVIDPTSHVPGAHKHDFLTECSVTDKASRQLACNGRDACVRSVSPSNGCLLCDDSGRGVARHPFSLDSLFRMGLRALNISALFFRSQFLKKTDCSPSNGRLLLATDPRTFSNVNGGYNGRPVTGSFSSRTFVVSLTAHGVSPVAGRFGPSIGFLR